MLFATANIVIWVTICIRIGNPFRVYYAANEDPLEA